MLPSCRLAHHPLRAATVRLSQQALQRQSAAGPVALQLLHSLPVVLMQVRLLFTFAHLKPEALDKRPLQLKQPSVTYIQEGVLVRESI